MPIEYAAQPIETERLLLRPFREADLDALHAMFSRDDVVRYLYEAPRSRDETRALLERRMQSVAIGGDGDTASFAIELTGRAPTVVGDCMLHLISESHGQGEIGFVVHPDHHGRGYATEAGRAMLRVAFERLRLHRVVGRLEARNAASARVLDKLGMRREAHFVENEWVKDEWQSEFVYAVLDREWRASTDPRHPGGRDETIDDRDAR
jgi:RimJ/RimL family protein N-acetyltransferase